MGSNLQTSAKGQPLVKNEVKKTIDLRKGVPKLRMPTNPQPNDNSLSMESFDKGRSLLDLPSDREYIALPERSTTSLNEIDRNLVHKLEATAPKTKTKKPLPKKPDAARAETETIKEDFSPTAFKGVESPTKKDDPDAFIKKETIVATKEKQPAKKSQKLNFLKAFVPPNENKDKASTNTERLDRSQKQRNYSFNEQEPPKRFREISASPRPSSESRRVSDDRLGKQTWIITDEEKLSYGDRCPPGYKKLDFLGR